MRLTLTLAALAAMVVTAARAEDPDARKEGVVTDEAIVNACGGDLTNLYKFGVPNHIVATRGDMPEEDDVLFRYDGGFILRVHFRTITTCFFLKDWEGPIRGMKIGDSREGVVKVVGKPRSVITDKDGVETDYGYDLKRGDDTIGLWVGFDEDGKVRRVELDSEGLQY